MSYLLDKKNRNKKIFYLILSIIFLSFLLYFNTNIFKGLSYLSQQIFYPFWVLGNNLGDFFVQLDNSLISKKNLLKENKELKDLLQENEIRMTDYNLILNENLEMKEILNRNIQERNLLLASILSKPNRSLYDTLIIDVGVNQQVISGSQVFALGDIPIGYISEVYANSSKVILYTTPGEKLEVVLFESNLFLEINGRGGGNFEAILPRDFLVFEGQEVSLPGIVLKVVGKIEKIISDPHDSFQKILLVSPVNIQHLKFVQVEI